MKKKVTNPILWSPSDERVKSSQMYKFIKKINEKNNVNIQNFTDVYEILKLMKLTEQVENERQLELFVNRLIDNHKNTNSHQTKKISAALKKEGNEAVNNSMSLINRLIGY